MAAGKPAAEAVDEIVAQHPDTAAYRQLLAVDAAGRTAIHSGRRALGTVGEHQAGGAAAAGNLLASAAVPRQMVETWHRSAGQPAETRLLAAFRAAMTAGGEAGPVHSAGLSVVAGYGWRVTDLRVDWSDDPLADAEARLGAADGRGIRPFHHRHRRRPRPHQQARALPALEDQRRTPARRRPPPRRRHRDPRT
jgi:uncharacterized Ntn-hydrolase superfamily protein